MGRLPAACCTSMDVGEEIRIAKGWVLDRPPVLISKGLCSKRGWLTKGILPREMSGMTTLGMDG